MGNTGVVDGIRSRPRPALVIVGVILAVIILTVWALDARSNAQQRAQDAECSEMQALHDSYQDSARELSESSTRTTKGEYVYPQEQKGVQDAFTLMLAVVDDSPECFERSYVLESRQMLQEYRR